MKVRLLLLGALFSAALCAQYITTYGPLGAGATAGASLFSTTNSTTVTATSATTLIGAVSGSTTVAANTFTAGQALMFHGSGYYSTPATPASLTIDFKVGGTTRITTGAVVQIASVTNGVWNLDCVMTTRTAGAGGTQIANCIFNGTGSTLTPGEAPMFVSSTWTTDTTATNAIDLQATWSTATGSPTITSTNVAAWIPGAPVTSVNTKTGAVALTLNSSDFANEGTTTTVLHGAASGNPSFGAVSLTADVSGILPPANGGAGIHTYGATFTNGGSALATGISASVTIPTACTVTGWDISIPATDSGTATVKFLRLANGTASPGSGNSINTSGVGLSTGTHVHSTTTSDFTSTAIAAFDIIAVNLTAVATAIGPLTANFECTQ